MIYSIFAVRFTGCSVARSSRLLWEQEVAGSNPATPTKFLNPVFGMWRSLVAHTHGVRGVAGSNPVIPTNYQRKSAHFIPFLFCFSNSNKGTMPAY